MKKFWHHEALFSLVGALALFAAACGSSGSSKTGAGGSGATTGAGGTGATGSGGTNITGDALTPTATGFVSDPVTTVIGAWFAYGDSVGANANTTSPDTANSDCVLKGGFTADQCSQITTPTPGQPFAFDPVNGMCTSGTAAKVLTGKSGAADYSDMWGAGIGLDFNNPGGDAGAAGYFDMTPYKGIAFTITGSVIPPNKVRVNFPFLNEHGTDSPYYMGATMMASPLTNGQTVEVDWTDVGGPYYLAHQTPPVTPPAFDKTHVQAIQFQVFTNTSTATPYAFCINNLTLIPN